VELERIRVLCLGGTTCGFYVDIQPEAKSFMVRVASVWWSSLLSQLLLSVSSKVQGILENIRNFSKKAVVHITMDGDFHVVSESGLSKVGVAFPSFDVFSTDGSQAQNARSTQYVIIV
jgi:hypothetical protein